MPTRTTALLAALALALTLTLTSGCAALPEEDADVAASLGYARVCPTGAMVEGVDVSSWQGAIDWDRFAAESGKGFAIARVSDGTWEDPRFDEYYPAIRAAGVIRGSYQYFRPGQSAAAQADLLLRHVPELRPGDLPPILDVEATDGVSASRLVAGIHTWVDRVRAALGRDPIIYTGYYFWHDSVGDSGDFDGLPLWIAAYPDTCAYGGSYCPLVPAGWSAWTIWQYCDHGAVPGIADGTPDLDVFMGSRAELEALASGTPAAATVPDAGTVEPPVVPSPDAGPEAGTAPGGDAGVEVPTPSVTPVPDGSTSTDAGRSLRHTSHVTAACACSVPRVRPYDARLAALACLAVVVVVGVRRRR